MVILHARVAPMDRPLIPDGYVQVRDGAITAVGAMPFTGQDDTVVDAQGAWLLPGFVDAHTHLGMWEDSLGFEGDDGNEDTDPSTPHLRAIDAVNPFDPCFGEASAAGVTTVVTGPGSANPIGGQLCAMKTSGSSMEDMMLAAPVAMKMALGENPKTTYHGKNQGPVTRMATAAIIREQLFRAQRYVQDKRRAQEDPDLDEPEFDIKCEALLPVLTGELPVHIHAHRLDDIHTAQRIAREFSLQVVIVHATQGYQAAAQLAADGARLLCGPLLCDRSKPELRGLTPQGPALLYQAGLETAIVTDHPVIPIQYLPLCAGLAVREGLPHEAGLRAITLTAARLAGIDHRVGSLTVGKDADLVLFDEDPLTLTAKPAGVWIAGRRVV